ncbi:MAG: manganese efflux pump [Firmicutes bacterium]|nr:manganese efflux pump [Bacillota bacterium]MBR6351119.1 manganese efflux pump [Bacillota bacterium]
MKLDLLFFLNNILLGAGLAMDAFSVSLANGLSEPDMSRARQCAMAGTYAGFQFLMPVIGWFCVRTVAEKFAAFHKAIPYIALLLLLYIGGKMLLESRDAGKEEHAAVKLSPGDLVLQGIATSIDALSVGFTMADYSAGMALLAGLIIAAVTFAICFAGLNIGRMAGTKLAGKASVLGGIILIGIGIEIFIKGVFLK